MTKIDSLKEQLFQKCSWMTSSLVLLGEEYRVPLVVVHAWEEAPKTDETIHVNVLDTYNFYLETPRSTMERILKQLCVFEFFSMFEILYVKAKPFYCITATRFVLFDFWITVKKEKVYADIHPLMDHKGCSWAVNWYYYDSYVSDRQEFATLGDMIIALLKKAE